MSLTASNIQRNHRGLYFEFTGDGASTSITVPDGAIGRTRSAKAFVTTAGSGHGNHSGYGGFRYPPTGTLWAATATDSANNLTLTTTLAVTNAVVAQCAVIFDQDADA
jgi:hypothetical protein